MTLRQRVLKMLYPLWITYARLTGRHKMGGRNRTSWEPKYSIYELQFTALDGTLHKLDEFRGKKMLIVNTASDCVYTSQYAALQELYEKYKESLIVIGFPSSDFKNQEKLGEKEIASFCSKNYGVTFPLASKSVVKRRTQQHEVFQWLTNAQKNGWNDVIPAWNFSKYLVNESGVLTRVFGPPESPLSKKIQAAVRS